VIGGAQQQADAAADDATVGSLLAGLRGTGRFVIHLFHIRTTGVAECCSVLQ